METKIIFYMLVATAGVTATLALLEQALVDLIDSIVRSVSGGTERLVTALETGCAWLRGQTEIIIRNVSGNTFWGAAVAGAFWNLALTVTFSLAEYGLILLTLRAVGLSDQGSVLPFSAGFLTGIAFLACSIFYFEMLFELAGIGNFSGVWHQASRPVRKALIGLCVTCLLMVVCAGGLFAALRGASFGSSSVAGEVFGVSRHSLLVIATVQITLAVFVACGLAGWSVVRSFLHLYGVATAAGHGALAGLALVLRLARFAFEGTLEVIKRMLAVATAPWRYLYAWLARYESIRNALRLRLDDGEPVASVPADAQKSEVFA